MSQKIDFTDFPLEKVDQRAILALLAGIAIGIAFWGALFVWIAG